MAYLKIDYVEELESMATGRKTKADTRDVAAWALAHCKAAMGRTDIGRLEALYALEDPRS